MFVGRFLCGIVSWPYVPCITSARSKHTTYSFTQSINQQINHSHTQRYNLVVTISFSQIGMVAFNEDVYRPPGEKDRTCYYEQLAFATSENKAYHQTWLRGITGVSPSDYTKALSAAFEYFDDSLEVKDDSRARSMYFNICHLVCDMFSCQLNYLYLVTCVSL